MTLARDLSTGERLAQFTGDLEDARGRLLRLFELLLHGVVLGLEGEDGGVAL